MNATAKVRDISHLRERRIIIARCRDSSSGEESSLNKKTTNGRYMANKKCTL